MALSVAAELFNSHSLFAHQGSSQTQQRRLLQQTSFFGGSSNFLSQFPKNAVSKKPLREATNVTASAAGSSNPLGRFFKKVLNNTPIVGLLSNLAADAGNSFTHYSQFGRQVAERTSRQTDEAFADFEASHGKPARFGHVLFCCWIASSGAGLLRRDDVLVAAKRLRYSLDLQFEVENQERLMQEAVVKIEKLKTPFPDPPLVARVDVAVKTLCTCCIGRDSISEEDSDLLRPILKACFPGTTDSMIDDVLEPYLEGDDREAAAGVPEPSAS